jgi:hypothetical protein
MTDAEYENAKKQIESENSLQGAKVTPRQDGQGITLLIDSPGLELHTYEEVAEFLSRVTFKHSAD